MRYNNYNTIDEIKQALNMFDYNFNKTCNLLDELYFLQDKLYGVGGINYKDKDLAKYTAGTRDVGDKTLRNIIAVDEVEKEINVLCFQMNKLQNFFQWISKNPSNFELIECKYYYKYSTSAIADKLNCSKINVYKKIDKIITDYIVMNVENNLI